MSLMTIWPPRAHRCRRLPRCYPWFATSCFGEWDPIGVNGNELCRDEYDSYAPTVVQLLLTGTDEYKLMLRLSEFQRVSMGMSVIDDELPRRVARRLLALVAEAERGAAADGGG